MNFRASSIHRRASCPGSARLEAGLAEQDSEQAAEGTLLHSYLSNPKLDRAVLKQSQRDLLRCADDIREFVFSRVIDQCGISEDEPFEEGGGEEWSVEMSQEQEISGHTDDWRRYPRLNLVVVIDYKTGFKVVEAAASNLQLRSYAVGAVEEWPDTTRVAVAIAQPRLSFSERCTMALYERADIDASKSQLLSIIEEASKPDAPMVAGETQCRYCLAKLLCGAYKSKFLTISTGIDRSTVARAERSLAECTDDQLDQILVAVQFADFIKEQARDEARRRVEAGQLTNWTLGKASELRVIVDSAKAFSLLVLRGDLTKDEALACSKPSLTKIEEKIREKTKCTWSQAKDIVNETLAPVIEKEEKKRSLTRIKT